MPSYQGPLVFLSFSGTRTGGKIVTQKHVFVSGLCYWVQQKRWGCSQAHHFCKSPWLPLIWGVKVEYKLLKFPKFRARSFFLLPGCVLKGFREVLEPSYGSEKERSEPECHITVGSFSKMGLSFARGLSGSALSGPPLRPFLSWHFRIQEKEVGGEVQILFGKEQVITRNVLEGKDGIQML